MTNVKGFIDQQSGPSALFGLTNGHAAGTFRLTAPQLFYANCRPRRCEALYKVRRAGIA
jgi:hypothetical protein